MKGRVGPGGNYRSFGGAALSHAHPVTNPFDFQPSCFILAFPLAKVYDSTATVGVGVDTVGSAQHMVLHLDFTAVSPNLLVESNTADPNARGDPLGVTQEWIDKTNWEMMVIADTSRVMRVVGGMVTAAV